MFKEFRFSNKEEAERINKSLEKGNTASAAILRENTRYKNMKDDYPFNDDKKER